MKYVNPTVTDAGRNLLTQTNGNGTDCTEIDQGIFSNQKNTSNKSLDQFTANDFNMNNASVLRLPTVGVKHQTDTIQPEVNLDNSKLSVQYPVYMIGVLAHAKSDPNNEILLAVEESTDDPLILPKATDIDLNCTFALPVTLSNSDNVNVIMSPAGMVTDQDFNTFQNSVNKSLDSQSSQISTNTNNIAGNGKIIINDSTDINSLTSNVSNNTSDIADIQSNMANNSALTDLESSFSSANSQMYTDEASIVSNSASINDNYSDLSSGESNDVQSLNAAMKPLKCDIMDNKVTDLDYIPDGTYLLPIYMQDLTNIPMTSATQAYPYDYIFIRQMSQDLPSGNNLRIQIALMIGSNVKTLTYTRYYDPNTNQWNSWS